MNIEQLLDAATVFVVSHGINFITALIIWFVGRAISKFFLKLISSSLQRKKIDQAVISFATSIANAFFIIVILIAALSQLGVETTSVVAIIGAAGLAIGLALKDSLSNFASGVLIITFRPFRSGDYVDAAGVSGSVEAIGMFSSTLKTPDNKTVIVPNSAITSNPITNYSREATRRVDLLIGVSYDADLKQAKQVLSDVLINHPLVLKEPDYTVAVAELGANSVDFVVRAWVKTEDFWTVKFELTESIKLELDKAEIGIPYPQMDVHVQQQG